MKRSEVNQIIKKILMSLKEYKFPLPDFANYTLNDWKSVDKNEQELIDNMLGWDVSDFGLGNFYEKGISSFVFRNGNYNKKKEYPKPYCEKMIYVFENQYLPTHFHWEKTEDIINRGGGNLIIQVWNANENGEKKDTNVLVSKDGRKIELLPGEEVVLSPGQSITLKPFQYHNWRALNDDVILFEVSTTNDDNVDNRFFSVSERITEIEEDSEPFRLLFSDYKKLGIRNYE